MSYEFTQKLTAAVGRYITNNVSCMDNEAITRQNRIILNCPIDPLPTQNDFYVTIMEVNEKNDAVRVTVPFELPPKTNLIELDRLLKSIRSRKRLGKDLDSSLEALSIMKKVQNVEFLFDENKSKANVWKDIDIKKQIKELPAECIQNTIISVVANIVEAWKTLLMEYQKLK